MSISQMLLPEFDQEMASTRRLFENLPDRISDYKPHAKSMAMNRLAGHIAELPGWAAMTLTTEDLNITSDMKPLLVSTREEALAELDRNVKAAREQIAAASDEAFMKSWTLRFNGAPMMTMPRVSVVRGWMMNHLIHHRSQLGVYMRLNDIAIPGMYGSSADEPNMFAQSA